MISRATKKSPTINDTNISALEGHLLEQTGISEDFFWHRLRQHAVCSQLRKRSDTPFALLDIGAGAGFLGDHLAKEYPQCQYYFDEPLSSLRQLLKNRFGKSHDLTTVPSHLPVQYVTLLDVLEHQSNDREFLNTLAQRLETGTTLIVTVPAYQHLWSNWDEALGHFRRYTKSSLLKAFEGTPFDVQEVSYLFPEMLLPALFRKWKNKFLIDSQADETMSLFPQLPRPVNESIYLLGRATLLFKRQIPFGTSVFLTAIRR